jgi:alcohol dehydrogenase class IV
MDALTHAVEAVVSKLGNPVSEGLALQAVRMIAEHLPTTIEEPDNLEARVNMQIAASMAGWAFSIANTGLAHGMAHALGGIAGVAHGTANGILLPHVMRYNASVTASKLALIAQALGCPIVSDQNALALSGADAVSTLLKRIGHPTRLSELKFDASLIERCAKLARVDDATTTNPRQPKSADEILELFNQAM